jgi:hypothetical protein
VTDTKKLRKLVEASGLKYRFIAEKMNLSPFGLALKIDNKNDFKASEISELSIILGLSEEQISSIFLKKTIL